MNTDNINYNLILKNKLKELEISNTLPTLLLHSCCAPCSSAVLFRLCKHFEITVFYYNPNITDENEYQKRLTEQKRFIDLINSGLVDEIKPVKPIKLIACDFSKLDWENEVEGLEKEPEGGARCFKCYTLRLLKTAITAKQNNYDYFGTTLTVSPYKNSKWLNEIGKALEETHKVNFLYSDFKKENGYKLSIELSHKYGLYRQNYCGCVYSKAQKKEQ